MRYWLYDERTKKVLGPHLVMLLPKQAGFGPESKVAPAGPNAAKEWKPAKEVEELKSLFAPPPKASAPAGEKNGLQNRDRGGDGTHAPGHGG
ncbi:MAG: hypothetical protein ACHQ51_07985 [Elusimicrobiota bacterium]